MSTAIVGGGISGLTSAYYLTKNAPKHKITLIEASNRLGGWIKSNRRDSGVLFEQGPRTIRPTGKPGSNTLQLIEEIGLAHEILPISRNSPAARNRMIYVNGALYTLPNSLKSLFKTLPPFKKPLINYFANDLLAKKEPLNDDSLYNFVTRRFGSDIADYLISPLICGICAGNAKEISVNFLMSSLFDYEQKYGNISTGIVRHFFDKVDNSVMVSDLVKRAKNEKWSVYSFKNGCESLPKALDDKLRNHKNVKVELNNYCSDIEINNKKVILHCNNIKVSVDNIITSLPAKSLSQLVKNQHPQLSALLNNIKFVSVGVINMCFKRNQIPKEGFGFLVPPKENIPILGVIYDSCCFPAPDNCTVLTVMLGGHWFEKYFGNDPTPEKLLDTAKKYLKDILQISEEPVDFKVNILKNCIPQYLVGHKSNLDKIDDYIKSKNLPIFLCGSSFYGVGINDVILSSKIAVQNLLKQNNSL